MVGFPASGVTAGMLMFLAIVPTSFIIWYIWPERHKLGVIWFIIGMGVGVLWELLGGLNLLIDDVGISILLYNLTEIVTILGAVCWLLLTVEYTTETAVSRQAFAAFAIPPLILGLTILVDPDLLYSVDVGSGAWGIILRPEPAYLVFIGYNYLLPICASGLWIGEWFASEGGKRRRAELFLLATSILVAAGLLINAGAMGAITTSTILFVGPLSLLAAAGFIAFAVTEYQLFSLEPVALQSVVRGIDDGVVILDEHNRIVDTNPAARLLFGLDDRANDGRPPSATDLFGSYPELVTNIDDDDERRTEITLTVDGIERDVDLMVTPIEYGRGSRGKAVVLRDITSLKQRQRDLTLLKRVLTRVFRHNVRNDMTAIRGYAETIERQADGELAAHAGEILDQSDELIQQSRKTRLIAEVVDAENAVVTTDLEPILTEAVDRYRTEYADATITSSVPSGTTVRAHRSLGLAIEQLVENAIIHDPNEPTVRISLDRTDSQTGLVIEDTGPGIPAFEIEALSRGTESDLGHASGVGLWLVKWVVEYSGGELTLDTSDSGTRAVIWLQTAEPP